MEKTDSYRKNNNKIVRANNTDRLIGLMQNSRPLTTEELVKLSSLSYPTVFSILKELLAVGVVERQGYAFSTGGRQAYLYSICANYVYTIGIHVDSAAVTLVITNIYDGVIYQTSGPALSTPGDSLAELREMIATALKHTSIQENKILAVGLTTSCSTRSSLAAAVQSVCDTYGRVLDAPVESYADSAVQGFLDRERLAVAGMRDCIHVVFGESIDVTVYRPNGQKYELAGALDHTVVVLAGAPCACGKCGCLATYLNGSELYRDYSAAVAKRELALPPLDDNAEKPLFRLLLARKLLGDDCAAEAVARSTNILAVALSNLMVLNDEYSMVLSGLYTSNDIGSFKLLRDGVELHLPANRRSELNMIIGMTQPADCALGVCQMLNRKHFSRIAKKHRKELC